MSRDSRSALLIRLDPRIRFRARDDSPSGTDARSAPLSSRASTCRSRRGAHRREPPPRRACSEPSTEAWPNSACDASHGGTSSPPSRRRSSRPLRSRPAKPPRRLSREPATSPWSLSNRAKRLEPTVAHVAKRSRRRPRADYRNVAIGIASAAAVGPSKALVSSQPTGAN